MFKFLFGARQTAPEIKRETQRETVQRAQTELNEILSGLSPKARITIYPEEGTLTIDLPEQMPDEAKALPAPEKGASMSEAAPGAPSKAPSETAPEAASDTPAASESGKATESTAPSETAAQSR